MSEPKHQVSGSGGVSGSDDIDLTGYNDVAIEEMRQKLKEMKDRSTHGWNEVAIKEHADKVERMERIIHAWGMRQTAS